MLNAVFGLEISGTDWPGPSALTLMPRPETVDENASLAPIFLPIRRSMEMPPGGPRSCDTPGLVLSMTVIVACWLPCRALLNGLKNLEAITILFLNAATGW